LLYSGQAEHVTPPSRLSGSEQTANLWWPDDRTVRAWLDRSRVRRGATLRFAVAGENGVRGGGRHIIRHRSDDDLRRDIAFYLTSKVIHLVGG
jgi:hypothetical protein